MLESWRATVPAARWIDNRGIDHFGGQPDAYMHLAMSPIFSEASFAPPDLRSGSRDIPNKNL